MLCGPWMTGTNLLSWCQHISWQFCKKGVTGRRPSPFCRRKWANGSTGRVPWQCLTQSPLLWRTGNVFACTCLSWGRLHWQCFQSTPRRRRWKDLFPTKVCFILTFVTACLRRPSMLASGGLGQYKTTAGFVMSVRMNVPSLFDVPRVGASKKLKTRHRPSRVSIVADALQCLSALEKGLEIMHLETPFF